METVRPSEDAYGIDPYQFIAVEKKEEPPFWTCCGGVHLELDERCPICNDKAD